MIRRPPRSTLFPTRRSSDLDGGARVDARPDPGTDPSLFGRVLLDQVVPRALHLQGIPVLHASAAAGPRSEEHTSELQSRLHLVCRLLLEKKKTQDTINRTTQ